MAEYVEEYLVALGYDLHSEEGQKYLQMCEDMERRHEELTKSGKSLEDQFKENSKAQQISISGDKAETEQLAKLDDAYRQFLKTQSETAQVKPAAPAPEAPIKEAPSKKKKNAPEAPGAAPAQKPSPPPTPPKSPAPKKAPPHPSDTGETSGDQKKRIEGDREEVNLLGDMEKTVRQIGVAWNQLEHGNVFGAFTQGIKGAKQFADMLDKTGSSAQTTGKKTDSSKKSILDLLNAKGNSPANAASSGSEVAETAAVGGEAAGAASTAGVAAAGVAIAAVAALALVSKEAYNLADSLAQASVNVETMARQLWITDSAAWQLNNTLKAMGKTTADLNEIAINPTLNKQFKDLQEYQKTMLQLPDDFQAVSDKWNDGVTKTNEELRLSLTYLREMASYRLSKIFEPAFEGITWSAKEAVTGLADLFKGKVDLALPWTSSGSAQGTAANYAPQSSSYSNYEGAKVTYAPHIEVTANSDKASDIATAVSEAAQQRFAESALLKNLQSPYR